MLQEENRVLLSEGIRLLELKLTEAQIAALEDYVQLLIKWNKTYNLKSLKNIYLIRCQLLNTF